MRGKFEGVRWLQGGSGVGGGGRLSDGIPGLDGSHLDAGQVDGFSQILSSEIGLVAAD